MISTHSSIRRWAIPRSVWLFIVVLARLTAAVALPAAAEERPADPAPEVHTLLYMVPRMPVIIRLNVDIDGRTLDETWRAYVEDWFRQLDRDGDGVLRGEEAARIPAAGAEAVGIPSVRELAALKLAAPTGGAAGNQSQPRGDQTLADFASYLNRICGSPLTVNIIPRPPASNSQNRQSDVGQALFDRLDVDHSGQLSADELQWTAALSKLDRDDDDTLSRAELDPLQSPFFQFNSAPDKPAKAGQAMLYVRSSEVRVANARLLVDRYDGADGNPRDQQLNGAELGLSAEVLGRFDNDGNGALDLDELRQWLRAPTPDLELTCRLGTQNKAEPTARWILAAARPRPELSRLVTERMVIVDHVYLVLQKPQVVGGDQQQVNDILFKGLDQDGNGYLEQKELLPGSEFSADFPWMDANHDGKVFLQEFSTFLDRRRAALRARVELTIAEQANQLFELLDANDDGRLTDRELTGARTSFPKWDSNDDGHLVLSEIPHRWQCLFTRGAVSSRGPDSIRIVGGSMNANKAGAGGPVWFRQMDRNQDGEVARREFLGPLSSFDRLDTNRNGALDADEAAMAR